MSSSPKLNRRVVIQGAAAAGAVTLLSPAALAQQAPIKIGFGMSLTGGLAGGGKQSLLAFEIWRDEINAKGGLLGRPVQLIHYDDQSNPANVPGPLRQAHRHRQGRPRGLGLCDQPDHPGDADRDAEEPGLHGPVRHRRERQVQLRPLFLDRPERPGRKARANARLPRGRRGPEPQAADHRAHRRRRRVRANRDRRRARDRGDGRLQDHLRPQLSAEHRRLRADRPRGRGDQPGCHLHRLLPAGFGRPHPGRQRDRREATDVRRRHDRARLHADQGAARAAAQRHRQLRDLRARADHEIPRRGRVPENLSGEGAGRRRRPARLFPSAVRLCADAGARPGGERGRQPRPRASSPTRCARGRSTPSSAR